MSCIDSAGRRRAAGLLISSLAAWSAAAETVPAAADPLAPPEALGAELLAIQRRIALERARLELRKLTQPPPETGNPAGLPALPVPGVPAPEDGAGAPPPRVEHPWLPIAIYGIDGRLKARLRAGDGRTVAEAAPGDELPDGTRIVAITPERVSFAKGRGGPAWSLAVLRYGPAVFQQGEGSVR